MKNTWGGKPVKSVVRLIAIVVGLTVVGLVMLAAWWYFIVRERPEAREVRVPLQLSHPPLG